MNLAPLVPRFLLLTSCGDGCGGGAFGLRGLSSRFVRGVERSRDDEVDARQAIGAFSRRRGSTEDEFIGWSVLCAKEKAFLFPLAYFRREARPAGDTSYLRQVIARRFVWRRVPGRCNRRRRHVRRAFRGIGSRISHRKERPRKMSSRKRSTPNKSASSRSTFLASRMRVVRSFG